MRPLTAVISLSILSSITRAGYCDDLAFHATYDRDLSKIKLSWSNEGASEPILVKLGEFTGKSVYFTNTTSLYITGPGLSSGHLINAKEPAGIAGRISPFVVCLLPGSEYALTLEAKNLRLPGSKKTLADLRDRHWTLIVSFIGQPAVQIGPKGDFVPYDGISEYGIQMSIWRGKIEVVIRN